MSINIEVKQLPQPLLEFGGPGLFLDQKRVESSWFVRS